MNDETFLIFVEFVEISILEIKNSFLIKDLREISDFILSISIFSFLNFNLGPSVFSLIFKFIVSKTIFIFFIYKSKF